MCYPNNSYVTVMQRRATHDNSTSVNTYCVYGVRDHLPVAELSAKMRSRAGVGLMLGRYHRRRANII